MAISSHASYKEDMENLEGNTPALDADLLLIAKSVHRRGLAVPAIFFLELYKPLTRVLQNVVFFSTPILLPIFGAGNVQRVSKILEDSDTVELLIQKIELSTEHREGH